MVRGEKNPLSADSGFDVKFIACWRREFSSLHNLKLITDHKVKFGYAS